jgi:hypothetical protein
MLTTIRCRLGLPSGGSCGGRRDGGSVTTRAGSNGISDVPPVAVEPIDRCLCHLPDQTEVQHSIDHVRVFAVPQPVDRVIADRDEHLAVSGER